MNRSIPIIIMIVLIGLLGACSRTTVMPEDPIPGGSIIVEITNANFVSKETIQVTIHGQLAPVNKIINPQTIEVTVPMIDPGNRKIIISDNGSQLGTKELMVRRAPWRRLFIQLTATGATVLRNLPYSGLPPKPDLITERRLAYDLLDDSKNLIYTDAVPYPGLRGIEVSGQLGAQRRIQRVPHPGPVSTWIVIPYTKDRTTLQVFDVPAGLSNDDPNDRQQRPPIAEIILPAN